MVTVSVVGQKSSPLESTDNSTQVRDSLDKLMMLECHTVSRWWVLVPWFLQEMVFCGFWSCCSWFHFSFWCWFSGIFVFLCIAPLGFPGWFPDSFFLQCVRESVMISCLIMSGAVSGFSG